MEFSKVITISGTNEIYYIINQKPDGVIARSLNTNKVIFFSFRKSKVMFLNNIEVFSKSEVLTLQDILKELDNKNIPSPENNDEKVLNKFFAKISSDIDIEKVSYKDKIKIIEWYQLLKKKSISFE